MRKIGDITDGINLRITRNTQVFVDNNPALTIGFPQLLRQWRRRVTGSPDNRTSADKLALELNSFGSYAEHFRADFHLNIQFLKLLESRRAKNIMEHRQDLWRRIEQHDSRPLCLNIPKIMHNRSLSELLNCPSHFDSRRTSPDYDKSHCGLLKLRIRRGFGYLEGIQDAAAQLQSIREIF